MLAHKPWTAHSTPYNARQTHDECCLCRFRRRMSRVALVDVGRSKMLRCTIMIEEREWLPVVTGRCTYVVWHSWDTGIARKVFLALSAGQHSR